MRNEPFSKDNQHIMQNMDFDEDVDYVVLGGGLAGLSLAISLHQKGARVCLFERSKEPNDKPCGEGLMPPGVQALETLGLSSCLANIEPTRLQGIRYIHGQTIATGHFGLEPAYAIRRIKFDKALRQKAHAIQLPIFWGRARFIKQTSEHIYVSNHQSCVRGRFLFACDGLHSQTRQQVLSKEKKKKRARLAQRFGMRCHLPTESIPKHLQNNYVQIWLADEYELYMTPGKEETGCAILLEQDRLKHEGSPDIQVDRILKETLGFEPAALTSKLKTTGALEQPHTPAAIGRVFFVGDAAGYVDALTGEGMSLALGDVQDLIDIFMTAANTYSPEQCATNYHQRRKARQATHQIFTKTLLKVKRHPRLMSHVVQTLARHPTQFDQLISLSHEPLSIKHLKALSFGLNLLRPIKSHQE